MGTEAYRLLEAFRSMMDQTVAWYRLAGPAFAGEGLETDEFRKFTDERIEREKDMLRAELRRLLGSVPASGEQLPRNQDYQGEVGGDPPEPQE